MSSDSSNVLRPAPQALEAEQAVLGALMIDPSSMAKIADWLTADDFFSSQHRTLFAAIAALIDRSEPCDAVTMTEYAQANALDMSAVYIIELANSTPSAANIVAYAEIVAEASRKRAMIDIATEAAASAYARSTSSGDVIAVAMQRLGELQATRMRGGLTTVKAPMKLLYQNIVERYTAGPGLLGLPTPWHDVNEVTKGLRDSTLYVIGARPSMGKTIFGANIAIFNALRGKRVAFFSLEMGADEIMSRCIASVGDIPYSWVEQPDQSHPDSEMYWHRLSGAMKAILECNLVIDDTPYLSIDQLNARVRRAHMQEPIDLIVTDHLHDMNLGRGDNVRHEIGRAVQGHKTIAKELCIPALLLAQLNRNVTGRGDKRPTLADLRESGDIEQKADVVQFLHREDYYEPNTHLKGIVELITAKGRNIKIGDAIHLRNSYDHMRLDDYSGVLPEPPERDKRGGRSSFSNMGRRP